ncbi:MAG: small multi-drug export protein [Clostridia bacterium]|jgi:uncharacterized membrane protein|nr:small multi-drug export protein [Clostridia bacterium]
MRENIFQLVAGIPIEWQVFVLSMLPITELRAAIPYGIAQGLAPHQAMLMAVLGNILAGIPVLILLDPIISLISRIPGGKRFVHRVMEKTKKKGGKVAKYGVIGLVLFVAFPVPGTGVWTGSLVAHLFGFNFSTAIMALSGGILISAVIITLLSLGMLETLGLSLPWVIGILFGIIIAFYLGGYILKR